MTQSDDISNALVDVHCQNTARPKTLSDLPNELLDRILMRVLNYDLDLPLLKWLKRAYPMSPYFEALWNFRLICKVCNEVAFSLLLRTLRLVHSDKELHRSAASGLPRKRCTLPLELSERGIKIFEAVCSNDHLIELVDSIKVLEARACQKQNGKLPLSRHRHILQWSCGKHCERLNHMPNILARLNKCLPKLQNVSRVEVERWWGQQAYDTAIIIWLAARLDRKLDPLYLDVYRVGQLNYLQKRQILKFGTTNTLSVPLILEFCDRSIESEAGKRSVRHVLNMFKTTPELTLDCERGMFESHDSDRPWHSNRHLRAPSWFTVPFGHLRKLSLSYLELGMSEISHLVIRSGRSLREVRFRDIRLKDTRWCDILQLLRRATKLDEAFINVNVEDVQTNNLRRVLEHVRSHAPSDRWYVEPQQEDVGHYVLSSSMVSCCSEDLFDEDGEL